MDIRGVTLEDLEQIKQDYLNYFNLKEGSEWTKEKIDRRFKQLVERYDYIGLGLYVDHVLVGFALGCYEQFDDMLITKLNELFISSSHQSKGYGTKLLKEYEAYSKRGGAVRIQLESANDKVHRRFYNQMNQFLDASSNVLKAKSLN